MELVKHNIKWIEEYIKEQEQEPEENRKKVFDTIFAHISKFIDTNRLGLKVLEVGCGTGWLCDYFKEKGAQWGGIEISQQLVDYCNSKGYPVILYNIENKHDVPVEAGKFYDIIVMCSVLEHVEKWKDALANAYSLLKEGGLLYISTTNAMTLFSGEYPKLPFYSLMPNRVRYWLMKKRYGKDIMNIGVDFHQFYYKKLRNELNRLELEVHDASEVYDSGNLTNPSRKKRFAVWMLKKNGLKQLAVRVLPNNLFICVKEGSK